VMSGLLRRLSVVGCAGVLVVLLTAMFVPGAYASQRAGVTRAVPSDAAGRFGSFGSALVGSAPVGNGPGFPAVDPATHTLYVTNGFNENGNSDGGNTVSVIDERHCQADDVSRCKGPWSTLTVGSDPNADPSAVAIDQQTDTIYVADTGDNTVAVFNGATCNAETSAGCGQTPAMVPLGTPGLGLPVAIFDDPANHTVYIPNGFGDDVSMLDSATCNATDLGACPTMPPPTVTVAGEVGSGGAVDRSTHTVYVPVCGNPDVGCPAGINGVSVFDASTCNATVQWGCDQLGTLPSTAILLSGAQVDPANQTLYTANYDNTISAYDLRSCDAADLAGCATDTPGTVTMARSTGFEVSLSIWVVIDAPLHTVYAVDQKDDTVSAIDTNVCNGRHLSACATLLPPTVHTGEDPEVIALDPDTQTLYTANQLSNDVSVIDASRCNATDTRGCREAPPALALSGPGSLAADPAVSTLYVANFTGDTLSMIDTESCNAFRHHGCTLTPPTVNVGAFPQGVAVDADTHTVYVVNEGTGPSGSVSVINAATCNATTNTGCGNVHTLQVPGGNGQAVLSNQPGDLLAIDAATDTIYVITVSGSGPDTVSVFNGATCNASDSSGCNQAPHSVTVGYGGGTNQPPVGLAVDDLTDTVYVSDSSQSIAPNDYTGDTISVIDGATCNAHNITGCATAPKTVTVGPIGTTPDSIALDEKTDTVYVADLQQGEGSGTVSVINGATCNAATSAGCGQTPQNVTVGFGPVGIAFDYANRSVVVANIEDTSVSVINAATCNAIISLGCGRAQPKLPVGRAPRAVAIDPTVGTIYTSNGDNTVSIVPAIR
jgi:DNA-binding beta-propeller fold protein YncE